MNEVMNEVSMKIDEHELEATAKTLMSINDTVPSNFGSWQSFKEFIVSMAKTHMHTNTNIQTYGFFLTAYDLPDGTRMVRVSLSSSVAMRYLKSIGVH